MEPVNTDVSAGPSEGNGAAGNGSGETPGTPTLGMVLLAVEELWPESLAEDWDEVGLVAGHPGAVAADHTASGGSPSAVYTFLNTLNPGGLGRYASFTHVDNRQRIGWPTSRWSG